MLLDNDVVASGKPKPVPSLAGFVVKNGLKSFLSRQVEFPMPLSQSL
jgi:hypothetical protein